MSTAVNRIKCTISNVPGTAGDLVLGVALDTYRILGPLHDGLSFDGVFITEAGIGSEIRNGCIYNDTTGTLSRGTLEDGSALSFTAAAIVSIGMSAQVAQHLDIMMRGAFQATNAGAVQTITDGAWQVLHAGAGGCLTTTLYDPFGWWSADAAGKFQPNVPGIFELGLVLTIDSMTSAQRCNGGLMKNGDTAEIVPVVRAINGFTNKGGGSGAWEIPFNGTTDFAQYAAFTDGGATHTTSTSNWFVSARARYKGPLL